MQICGQFEAPLSSQPQVPLVRESLKCALEAIMTTVLTKFNTRLKIIYCSFFQLQVTWFIKKQGASFIVLAATLLK
jgi:hypothetical protein